MKWEDAVKLFGIGEMYRDVSFENAKLLPAKTIDLGKRWVASKKKTSLFLCGNVGSGKSYFSLCLVRGLVELGHRWIIPVKSADLDAELLNAIEEKKEQSVLRKYCEVDFLLIDDLGVERLSDRIQRQYYAIIDARTENYRSTIITSNFEKRNIHEVLGARIASRLEMAYEIKFPNKDLRKHIILDPIF